MSFSHTNFPEEQGAKLVRDKIPEIIEKNEKVKALTKVLDEPEYIEALVKKLFEEFAELKHAVKNKDVANMTEEMADILEILHAIGEAHKINFDDVVETRNHKRDIRGGFDKRILLLGKEKPASQG